MKIALAQIESDPESIGSNIKKHIDCIHLALSHQSDAIFFPELSITGYEPILAKRLAFQRDDKRFLVFKNLSEKYNITLGLGVPLQTEEKPQIAMVIFQKGLPVRFYTKRMLHEDEFPFFSSGNQRVEISLGRYDLIPGICFENFQEEHWSREINQETNVFVASVAKHQKGIVKGSAYLGIKAKKYKVPVLMVNSVGKYSEFTSSGTTTIWNTSGDAIKTLSKEKEEILIYNHLNKMAITVPLTI